MDHLGSKATPVEDCLGLGVGALAREGTLSEGPRAGSLNWMNAFGERVALVLWETEPIGVGASVLRLRYTVRRWGKGEGGEEVVEPVCLVTTRPNFGGARWWFACPLVMQGSPCARRVAKLYLPSGGRYFGCRGCYGLTYRSVRKRRSWLELFRKDPDAALAALERKVLRLPCRRGGRGAGARPRSKGARCGATSRRP